MKGRLRRLPKKFSTMARDSKEVIAAEMRKLIVRQADSGRSRFFKAEPTRENRPRKQDFPQQIRLLFTFC